MKFRSILAIAALAVLSFTACEETENLGEAKVSVTPSEVSLDATGEKSEVVALTATRDWHIENTPEWVVVNPSSGKASTSEQTVTISVDPNKGNDREDDIIFTIGLAKASLHVKQAGEAGELKKGSGTLEDPYSVAGVIEYCQSLGADVQSPDNVYIQGTIASVSTTYEASGTYGNATFYIVDNEGDTDQFYVFQTLYLGNRKWKSGDTDVKAGDKVIICGKVVNYKGNTPETVSKGGSFVYSLNGVTEGTVEPEDPSKVEQITCAQFIEKADPNTTYRLVGKVTSSVNTTYCSFDMNDGTATVVVWTVNNKDEWKDKVKKDGTVTVRGKYLKYEKDGNVKHEMVDAYIEKFEEGTVEPEDPSKVEQITCAQFIEKADPNTTYRLVGKVTSSVNATYCSFDMNDGTATVVVWTVNNKDEWKDKVKKDGTVTVRGKYLKYEKDGNVKHEMVDAYIEKFEEGQGGGQEEAVTGTVSETIVAKDDDKVVANDAIVAAICTKGFIATDGKQNVYVFLNKAPEAKLGDKVKIEATKTTYYGLPEFKDATITVVNSGNSIPRTELKDITSSIDSYASSDTDYLTATGTLDKNTNGYYIVKVDGATRAVSPQYLDASIDPSALLNQKVAITGYFNTIHTKNNYVQVIATEIKAADPNAKYCTVSTKAISAKASDTEATFTINANAAWTVTSDNSAFTVTPASGDANATVKVTFAANETDKAVVANLKVVCTDAKVEETVVLTQAAKSSTPSGKAFVKVTTAPNDWSGTYLIVNEDNKVAFDGKGTADAANLNITVDITEGSIAATDAALASTVTVETMNGGYALKTASGKYLSGTKEKNAINFGTTQVLMTISLDASGNAVITDSAADTWILYNAASDQKRFRFYKKSSTAPKAVQLYKLSE